MSESKRVLITSVPPAEGHEVYGTLRPPQSLQPESIFDPPPPYESIDSDLRNSSTPRQATRHGYSLSQSEHDPSSQSERLELTPCETNQSRRHLTGFIVLSCFVLCFFNFVFGLIAFIMAVLGKQSEADGQYDQANSYAKYSCYLSLAGMIITAIFACVLLTIVLAHTV